MLVSTLSALVPLLGVATALTTPAPVRVLAAEHAAKQPSVPNPRKDWPKNGDAVLKNQCNYDVHVV
jgi:hypothetical protein